VKLEHEKGLTHLMTSVSNALSKHFLLFQSAYGCETRVSWLL